MSAACAADDNAKHATAPMNDCFNVIVLPSSLDAPSHAHVPGMRVQARHQFSGEAAQFET
jgi:hypothetical protein